MGVNSGTMGVNSGTAGVDIGTAGVIYHYMIGDRYMSGDHKKAPLY
jgi:hypothetical protein